MRSPVTIAAAMLVFAGATPASARQDAEFLAEASAPAAEQAPPSVDALLTPSVLAEIDRLLSDPIVTLAVTTQNDRRADVTSEEIAALDAQWVREAAADGEQPLIAATLGHPLSTYLLRAQARSLGLYCEIFVMDRSGLNVGQSSVTSDYWQGDEAKVQETLPKGVGAVFIDAPEHHAETDTWRVQVNVTLEDAGTPIGVGTVEVNLTELARRAAAG
jgi:hypothetical protein